MNVTRWWTTSPGPMLTPSASGNCAEKAPAGALARVTVTATLPVFVMSKLRVTLLPTVTAPKSVVVGVIVSRPWPDCAVPVRGTDAMPLVVRTVRADACVPAWVGA